MGPPLQHGTQRPTQYLSGGLSTAVRVFFYIVAGSAAAGAAATLWELTRFQAWWDAPVGADGSEFSDLIDAEEITDGVRGLMFLAAFVLFILMIIWSNQAYKATHRFTASGTRWSSGWAVGGWFIPFANLVIPKMVINEIDRISNPATGGPPVMERWKGLRLLPSGHWWWGLFIVGWITLLAGDAISEDAIGFRTVDDGQYVVGLAVQAVGAALYTAAALFGAQMVKGLNQRLVRPAASPETFAVTPEAPY